MMPRPRLTLTVAAALLAGMSAFGLLRPRQRAWASTNAPGPLRALLVGGGPDLAHNQVAIESNIRYVHHLLPKNSFSRILFTDGNPRSVNVQYEDVNGHTHYRSPRLPVLDGPSRLASFDRFFQSVGTQSAGPLLLYFTGHGGPAEDGGYDNNEYDMWSGDTLNVRHLAAHIDSLPAHTPVVVVMVECFSGGFGNLLFQGGDPNGPVTNKDLCGFFASIPDREAAGCTPEVNEADYRDFTSYFFAALSGQDRLGRAVTGADYNHDGKVGMNEAFAYTLIHDVSIDTPVCTSDVFLRRFVKTPDSITFATAYRDVLKWASPAQQAALEGLSQALGYHRENNRLATAYAQIEQMTGQAADDEDEHDAQVIRFVRVAKSVILAHRLQTSGDAGLKSRYTALTAAEARNPLR